MKKPLCARAPTHTGLRTLRLPRCGQSGGAGGDSPAWVYLTESLNPQTQRPAGLPSRGPCAETPITGGRHSAFARRIYTGAIGVATLERGRKPRPHVRRTPTPSDLARPEGSARTRGLSSHRLDRGVGPGPRERRRLHRRDLCQLRRQRRRRRHSLGSSGSARCSPRTRARVTQADRGPSSRFRASPCRDRPSRAAPAAASRSRRSRSPRTR